MLSMVPAYAVNPSKIALILPLTGRLSQVGEDMQSAAEMAFENYTSFSEPTFSLRVFDHYSNPDSAETIALRIAKNDEFIAIAGGYPSSCAYRIAQISAEYAIPYLVLSSSDDTLTQMGNKSLFRIAPPSSDYNDGLLGWAASIAGSERKIAVVSENHPRNTRAEQDIRDDLKAIWRGESNHYMFNPGNQDFSEIIQSLERYKPTLVWIIGSTADAARFLRQCREADWQPVSFIFGLTNLVNNRIISLSDGAADFAFAPVVWWAGSIYPGSGEFVEAFQNRRGHNPDYHAAESYAGLQVLASALGKTRDHNRQLLQSLLSMTNQPTVVGNVHFERFKEYLNQNRMMTLAVQQDGKRWACVWPLEMAERNYTYPAPTWSEREVTAKAAANPSINFLWIPLVLLIGVMLYSGSRRRQELMRKLDE